MYVKDTTLFCESKVEYDFIMLLARLGLLVFPEGVAGFAGVGKWAEPTKEQMSWGGW